MDLSTMEERLGNDLYQRSEDFTRDSKLILDNGRRYNNETLPYAKSANRLEKFMWLQVHLATDQEHCRVDCDFYQQPLPQKASIGP